MGFTVKEIEENTKEMDEETARAISEFEIRQMWVHVEEIRDMYHQQYFSAEKKSKLVWSRAWILLGVCVVALIFYLMMFGPESLFNPFALSEDWFIDLWNLFVFCLIMTWPVLRFRYTILVSGKPFPEYSKKKGVFTVEDEKMWALLREDECKRLLVELGKIKPGDDIQKYRDFQFVERRANLRLDSSKLKFERDLLELSSKK